MKKVATYVRVSNHSNSQEALHGKKKKSVNTARLKVMQLKMQWMLWVTAKQDIPC